MSECIDPRLGALLLAYGLNALSEEDFKRFEIHLLECEHCFEQLKSFRQVAPLLRSDTEVRERIRQAAREGSPQSESILKRFWRYLWPEVPWVFKPALVYLLILLLIIPVYLGFRGTQKREISPPQIITLTPELSAMKEVFHVDLQREGLLQFVFRDAVMGMSYHVVIQSEEGNVVYENAHFNSFDEYGRAQLIFPSTKMKLGGYRLVITDPGADPPLNRQEYRFQIEK